MRFILALLISCISFAAFSQNITSRFTARERGWTTFGINGGWAYQSSDVRTTFNGWGAGMTLGKNLAYRPGGALSFDIRGRLLFTRSYGNDWQATTEIQNNTALNGEYRSGINYLLDQAAPTDSSYVFSNYRTGMGELGVEGVLTFNRLRERTGIVFSLFGGVGVDLYRTRIDQAASGGIIYDYQSVDRSRGKANVLSQLDLLRDGVYETRADGSTKAGLRAGIMPGAGVELGYQLTRRFVIGVGHKITFSRTDVLDGQRWEDTGIATNDWAHYTNIFMRWDIARHVSRARAPIIEITEPNRNPSIAENPNAFIRANIRNVNSGADVRCYLNGELRPFDFRNGRLGSSVRLQPGRNEFRIEAFNPAGRDEETVVIIWEDRYNPPPPPPPTAALPAVRITNPSYSPFTSNQTDMYLRAQVDNIRDKRDVRLFVNGNEENRFTMAEGLEASLRLREGRNIVRVEAVNAAGRASDEVVIEVNSSVSPPPPPPPSTGRKPIVDITQPAGSTAATNEKTYVLRAKIVNVDSRDYVTVLANNQPVRDFQFYPASGELTVSLDLIPADNRVVVQGRNSAGTGEAQVVITRDNVIVVPPRAKPEVAITTPKTGETFNQASISFTASTKNIDEKNQVIVVFNGATLRDFNFNSGAQLVSGNLSLRNGDNTLTVKVTTPAGSDEATARFKYEKAVPRPDVSIVSPANGAETGVAQTDLRASVSNVTNKNDIQVYLNGRTVSNFTFLSSSGQVAASLTLVEGENTIRVTAKNSTGAGEASSKVRLLAKKVPTVKITAPADRTRVSNPVVKLSAQTTNVFSERNIQVKLNNTVVSGAALDRAGNVTASLTLKEGSNTIEVEASTPDGIVKDNVTVVYAPAVAKPTITFVQPGAISKPVARPSYQFKAKVTDVKQKSDLSATLNGKSVRLINFNAKSGEVTFSGTLSSGANEVVLTAKNTAGTVTEKAAVTYQAGTSANKPEVDIQSASQPTIDPLNPGVAKTSVVAYLKNVPDKNQISITANGAAVTVFTYNTTTGLLNFAANLKRGKNNIEVKATTAAGTASDTTVVNW